MKASFTTRAENDMTIDLQSLNRPLFAAKERGRRGGRPLLILKNNVNWGNTFSVKTFFSDSQNYFCICVRKHFLKTAFLKAI
jgi:hypothetical protein